ncbi:8-amino-7-oxononanoate synthase [Leptolyngbya sp. AN02str]|uniref:8-amino-7-oxononanoate synthase n=1 Tax=Leptolyngbya sp. AN02str TaxID=3423363 RepID=UPI003D31836D
MAKVEQVKTNKFGFVEEALAQRRRDHLLRAAVPFAPEDAVRGWRGDRPLVNFSSNDYLGLSKHPRVIAAAQEMTMRYGTSASASRLITGTLPIHQELEERLAAACGQEAALLFNSGFQANATILPALLDASSVVLCDRLVHNSMVQGMLASGARLMRYQHNDLEHLERLLDKAAGQGYSRMLIASETVFSMDGDRSDVSALVQLTQTYNAILYLDDAHALGVLGKNGVGLAAHQPGVDLVIGTFGKAFGAFGAFVACSRAVRDYLVNCCPGFIYTTALPPGVIGAISAALELVPSLDAERQRLHFQAEQLRQHIRQLGYDTRGSSSQIVPLVVGDEAQALHLSHWLETQGLLASAIRPPTVPRGTARLRFALSSQHTGEQLQALMQAIEEWHGRAS